MARTKYAEHVGKRERREGTVSRDEYLMFASANAKRGADLPQTQLLPLDIGEIRSAARQRQKLREHIANNLSNEALAKKFNVHIRTIEKVMAYETASHVP